MVLLKLMHVSKRDPWCCYIYTCVSVIDIWTYMVQNQSSICSLYWFEARLEWRHLKFIWSIPNITGHWKWKKATECIDLAYCWQIMMASSNGNIFRVTGPLWGESTGHRWIPLTKANDTELWCFFDMRLNKQTVKQTIETPVIWDAVVLLWRFCNVSRWRISLYSNWCG